MKTVEYKGCLMEISSNGTDAKVHSIGRCFRNAYSLAEPWVYEDCDSDDPEKRENALHRAREVLFLEWDARLATL